MVFALAFALGLGRPLVGSAGVDAGLKALVLDARPAPASPEWVAALNGLSPDAPALTSLSGAPLVAILSGNGVTEARFAAASAEQRLAWRETARAIAASQAKAFAAAAFAETARRDLGGADPEELARLRDDWRDLAATYGPHLDAASTESLEVARRTVDRAILDRSFGAAEFSIDAGVERPSAPDAYPRHGVEVEFVAAKPFPREALASTGYAYVGLLQKVKEAVRGGSPILVAKNEKFKERVALRQASFHDRDGRTWQVIPEAVDGAMPDVGDFELVTPPLRPGTSDEDALVRALKGIARDGRYVRGGGSSTHYTFDVDHLIETDGNAARLADAILFIESHWRELYAAVSPVRYGTLVNPFSVPLAVDQKELLRELASMPRRERTFDAMKALFERFVSRESVLHMGDEWKYRAANYGKLFGLRGAPPLRVLEIRIADFPRPGDTRKVPALFRRILAGKAPFGPQDRFDDPFAGAGTAFERLNAAIAALPAERYQDFLRSLGLSAKDYPRLGRLRGPPPHRAPEDAVAPGRLLERALLDALPVVHAAWRAEDSGPADDDALLGWLMGRPEIAARRFAAMALKAREGPVSRELLGKALEDEYCVVRRLGADALRHHDEPETLDLVEKALKDQDGSVREWAADSLYRWKGLKAARLAASALHDSNPGVVYSAVQALMRQPEYGIVACGLAAWESLIRSFKGR